MNKKILYFIIVAIIFIFSGYVYTVEWDNLKLRLVKFWGFATLQNNPLLENFDKDFKMLNKEEKEEALIPVDELLSGGVPKDGIPSIDNPVFVDAKDTVFGEDEIVVGVYLNGEARAYPYGILNWHEIINDKIGDTPISVTLCPLCDTNPVFVRIVNGKEIVAQWDQDLQTVRFFDGDKEIPSSTAFGFVYPSFFE